MSQVFISYKTGQDDGLTQTATHLQKALQERGFTVWRDETNLTAADKWSDQIYKSIRDSEVLLLLLSEQVIESNWVRREVDVAKGALVTIIPVLIRGGFDTNDVLTHFDLYNAQYVDWRKGNTVETENLEKQIIWGIEKTQKRREDWRKEIARRKACETVKSAYAYRISGLKGICLHIATGDLTAMRGIDVIVNTENDYMQMGRYFEVSSVSSQIRLKGSKTDAGGSVEEDTLQLQIYNKLRLDHIRIPLLVGRVLTTPAGHPEGRLRKHNKNRYVFHLVTTRVNPLGSENRFTPIEEGAIDDAIKQCFEKVIELNARRGVISPQGTDDYETETAQADTYQPVQSIIIPLFGTGHAGNRNVRGVAKAIVDGVLVAVREYADDPNFSLKDIYISAFSDDDYIRVKQVMSDHDRLKLVDDE